MTFKAKIVCDTCLNEKEFDTEDAWSIDLEINAVIGEGEWLFDDENDTHYCPKCAPVAAEEQGLEYRSKGA